MAGTPISRNWVVVLRSGVPALDWGNGSFVDLINGCFIEAKEPDVSHRAMDADLEWLKQIGVLDDYDDTNAYFLVLPNQNRTTSAAV
jgi:hypothetical protein